MSSATSTAAWRRTRWLLVGLGVSLPYIARIGSAGDYWSASWQAQLFLLAVGAVMWLPLLALTWLYRYRASMWPPALLGLGFAFWAHVSVDLQADAQAGIAVVMIPFLSLAPTAIGALMGWGLDWRLRRKPVHPNHLT